MAGHKQARAQTNERWLRCSKITQKAYLDGGSQHPGSDIAAVQLDIHNTLYSTSDSEINAHIYSMHFCIQ